MLNYSYSENEIIYLPVNKILPNPYQPRKDYNRESLMELSGSIKQYGVLQPILVRYINNRIYELVSGERRLKATKLAGFSTIPAMVVYGGDKEAAALSIAENIQRTSLNYIEEAEAIRILSEGFKYTTEEISHIINKPIEYIEELKIFVNLPYETKTLFINKKITKTQATALLKIENEIKRKELIMKIYEYNLNDNAVIELVENTLRQYKIQNTTELNFMKMRSKFKDIRLFTNTIKQAIALLKEAGLETGYTVSRNSDEYEITIKIKPI